MPTFEAGIAKGELRDDLDLEIVSEMLYAPLWLRMIIGHRPLTPAVVDRILVAAWPILTTDPDAMGSAGPGWSGGHSTAEGSISTGTS